MSVDEWHEARRSKQRAPPTPGSAEKHSKSSKAVAGARDDALSPQSLDPRKNAIELMSQQLQQASPASTRLYSEHSSGASGAGQSRRAADDPRLSRSQERRRELFGDSASRSSSQASRPSTLPPRAPYRNKAIGSLHPQPSPSHPFIPAQPPKESAWRNLSQPHPTPSTAAAVPVHGVPPPVGPSIAAVQRSSRLSSQVSSSIPSPPHSEMSVDEASRRIAAPAAASTAVNNALILIGLLVIWSRLVTCFGSSLPTHLSPSAILFTLFFLEL
mmetsp:Transcript_36455/g.60391  ORF Transcript_36455/g.60391 Transcript_36455/m.60391 type:complete len:272 (-) Transcript_36455:71-886(-)